MTRARRIKRETSRWKRHPPRRTKLKCHIQTTVALPLVRKIATPVNEKTTTSKTTPLQAMDLTYLAVALPATKQEIIWWLCFSILTYAVFTILLRSDAEDAIEFSVPVPEACRPGWKGKQLDDPSIKVRVVFSVTVGSND